MLFKECFHSLTHRLFNFQKKCIQGNPWTDIERLGISIDKWTISLAFIKLPSLKIESIYYLILWGPKSRNYYWMPSLKLTRWPLTKCLLYCKLCFWAKIINFHSSRNAFRFIWFEWISTSIHLNYLRSAFFEFPNTHFLFTQDNVSNPFLMFCQQIFDQKQRFVHCIRNSVRKCFMIQCQLQSS